MSAIGWVMIANSSNCLISPGYLASIAEGDSIINATLLTKANAIAINCNANLIHCSEKSLNFITKVLKQLLISSNSLPNMALKVFDSLTWSFKQPFIPCDSLLSRGIFKVQNWADPQGRVCLNHLERSNWLLQYLTRVQGERLLGQPRENGKEWSGKEIN